MSNGVREECCKEILWQKTNDYSLGSESFQLIGQPSVYWPCTTRLYLDPRDTEVSGRELMKRPLQQPLTHLLPQVFGIRPSGPSPYPSGDPSTPWINKCIEWRLERPGSDLGRSHRVRVSWKTRLPYKRHDRLHHGDRWPRWLLNFTQTTLVPYLKN